MLHLYPAFAKAEWPFKLTLIAYTLAFLAYLASLWAPAFKDGKDRIYAAARGLFLAGFALNTYTLIGRGLETGRPPFKTFHESLVYFAFLFGLLAVLIERLKKLRFLGAIALAIILGALGYALHKQDIEAVALPPALNSGWFLPHATIYFSAYASVTVAFALGVLALCKPGDRNFEPDSFWGRALGAEEVNFEGLHRQWLRLGFLLLASGLVTGVLWAKLAWTDHWSWDPKEAWGLATLLIYGAILHMHHTEAFKGRKVLWASLGAWAFILFTYFCVGCLPTRSQSMHLYTEPPRPSEAKDVNGINPEMY